MKIVYRFTFEDGTRKVFTVNLYTESLNVVPPDHQTRPEWAKLANYRCHHCQLDENVVRYCPIAVNISDVVDFFKFYTSHDKVEVLVVTEERVYGKKTTVQKAVVTDDRVSRPSPPASDLRTASLESIMLADAPSTCV